MLKEELSIQEAQAKIIDIAPDWKIRILKTIVEDHPGSVMRRKNSKESWSIRSMLYRGTL